MSELWRRGLLALVCVAGLSACGGQTEAPIVAPPQAAELEIWDESFSSSGFREKLASGEQAVESQPEGGA